MQATAAPQAPVAPPAPGAPVVPPLPPLPPTPQIIINDATGAQQTLQVPRSEVELRALREHRRETSNQLENVSSRRRDLAQEILSSPEGVSRTGLEARLGVLDQRIVQLEGDLAETGRLLALAPAELVAGAAQPNPSGDFEEGLLVAGFSALIAFPLIFYFLKRRWKKKNRPASTADMSSDNSRRLERLEQGMDSIAVEIERVSEGQRFVTRLLSEGQGAFSQRRVAESSQVPTSDV